jgi:hypothetical protein
MHSLTSLVIIITLVATPLLAANFELDIRELDRQPTAPAAAKQPTPTKPVKKPVKPDHAVKPSQPKTQSHQDSPKVRSKQEARSIIAVHGTTQCDRAASLLGQLGILFSKGEEIPVGREGSGLSVKTDLLFSAQGRRYAVFCTRPDEGAYTLIRIAEMQGLQVIRLETDRFLLMGEKILSALGLQYTTASEQVKTRRGKKTVTGFLVSNKGKEIFVTGE